jgi:hypothetical protein
VVSGRVDVRKQPAVTPDPLTALGVNESYFEITQVFGDDSFVDSVAEMSHLTESYLMRAVEAGSGPNNPL